MDFNVQPEQHSPQILTRPIRLALFKLIKYAFLRLICPCSVSANQEFLGHQINTNCTWSCLAPTRPLSLTVTIFATVTPLLEDFIALTFLPPGRIAGWLCLVPPTRNPEIRMHTQR